MAESVIKLPNKLLKMLYFTDTTDSNSNLYNYQLNTSNQNIVQCLASNNHACTPMLDGDGTFWNYHISDYTNWNVGSGVQVIVFIYYYDV